MPYSLVILATSLPSVETIYLSRHMDFMATSIALLPTKSLRRYFSLRLKVFVIAEYAQSYHNTVLNSRLTFVLMMVKLPGIAISLLTLY